MYCNRNASKPKLPQILMSLFASTFLKHTYGAGRLLDSLGISKNFFMQESQRDGDVVLNHVKE